VLYQRALMVRSPILLSHLRAFCVVPAFALYLLKESRVKCAIEFEAAMLCDVVLVAIRPLNVIKLGLLPLGGSDINQIAILCVVAFVIYTVRRWRVLKKE
jgi:hypothetical protein